MSVYAVSDIHGEYDRFKKLLSLIRFSDQDELYIIGDVIDRGPDGVPLLSAIMEDSRMHLILGNHEYMCLQYFSPNTAQTDLRRWNRNGNYHTLSGFDRLTPDERDRMLAFLTQLPDHAMLCVNGRDYVLVHGFWANNTHDRVWNRPTLDTPPVFDAHTTLVIGHTPVCEYVCPGSDEDAYVCSRALTEQGDHFRILRTESFIDIDCCCGYGMSAGRLACLRLDDGAEFYA